MTDAAVTITRPGPARATGPWPSDQSVPNGSDDIARFAGGIAHDVNTMLSAIRGFAVLARAELEPDAPATADIDEVIAATDRAATLVRELLVFSTVRAKGAEPVAPGPQIAALAPMLRLLVGDDVALVFEDRSRGAVVRADPAQLDQVIVNLALNARDAMPTGGLLEILTTCFEGEQIVRIEVSDTGDGMDAPTAARVFEPYFTTKGDAGGTGLGLPNALDFARSAGGTIGVRSARGAGTTVRIDLPQAVAA